MSSPVAPYITEMVEIIDPLGTKFTLRNGYDRFVLSDSGFGQPPIEYISSSGPFQDGDTVRDFRLRPRIVILGIDWKGCDRDEYWERRAALLDILRPNRQTIGRVDPFTLRITKSDLTQFDLYVMPSDGPAYARDNTISRPFSFGETVRLLASDPLWYGADETVLTLIPSTTDQLVFPITFPIVFGLGVASGSLAVGYGGTWPAFPVITIDGPAAGPKVTNLTTGELLYFPSYTVALGERVTIDLSYAAKTITNNLGENLVGYLSTDSDLATWHLEPSPGAPGGVNTIDFAASGAGGSTALGMTYRARYTGI